MVHRGGVAAYLNRDPVNGGRRKVKCSCLWRLGVGVNCFSFNLPYFPKVYNKPVLLV